VLHHRTCDWEEEIAVLVGGAFGLREGNVKVHPPRYAYLLVFRLAASSTGPERPSWSTI
jgi:hypothetical protein